MIGLFFMFAGSSTIVFGCSCEIRPPACFEYTRTPNVFLGTVESVNHVEGAFAETVEIEVTESFRGETPRRVYTNNQTHSCSHRFEKGDRYLFYGSMVNGRFATSLCTRTAKESVAAADLGFLRSVNRGETFFWLAGTMSEAGYAVPLADISASILNVRPKMKAVSDPNGNLVFDVKGPGKYKVRVHLPQGRTDVNGLVRNDFALWELNRKQIIGGRHRGNNPYVDFEVNVEANRCGWFDVSIP